MLDATHFGRLRSRFASWLAPHGRARPRLEHCAKAAAIGLVVLVVVYGAILRFDALTLRFGPVQRPGWLHALQQSRGPSSVLRPASFTWDRVTPVNGRIYISDPYTYLQHAREMRSFYAAHRREPVFPFVTKIFLWLLDQQDQAVSFTSAFFSVLAIIATFLLGSYAFSYGVGLGAALALAIEYDVIFWGVDGGRDDAFTCAIVLSAYAMLRVWRCPSRRNAILAGVVAGFACLVRITSLSFLLPGFACLLLSGKRPRTERLRAVGLGLLLMMVIVGPFPINCWRAYGDPFHTINVHADVYRAADGQAESGQSAAAYVAAKLRSRPAQTLDTVALGLTSYPFTNKWHGFDRWSPALGRWLSWCCLVGLVLFTWSPPGRLLLLVLAASLVPYAITWRLIADWRFTEHAYPLFLIASCFAVAQVCAWAAPWRLKRLVTQRPRASDVLRVAFVVCAVTIGAWTITRALPVLTLREALLAGEEWTIMAGDRDGSFFGEGWSRPMDMGVTVRVSNGASPVVWIPLPGARDYDLTFRLDPFPEPIEGTREGLPVVWLFVNGHPLSRFELRWTPGRIGSYDVRLPAGIVKEGFNRFAFNIGVPANPGATAGAQVHERSDDVTRLRLWYVRVRPAMRAGQARIASRL